ncbi:pimeloyl-ACP methyl ester carboxylesterase [Burkholderia sp. OAS925]
MSAVPSATAAASHATLEARVARFPARQVELASQRVLSYREACETSDALPLVLLHGIGSGAASWVQQFEALSASRRVLAWDAPGYGESTPVAAASPAATDYANVLYEWLEKLGIERCVLVGHSLGAIIAGSFAAMHPQRVAGLLLLSPAGGYGAASAEVRETKRDQRLAMLNELGPQGLAEKAQRQYVVRACKRRSACMGALEHVACDSARLRAGHASARQRGPRQRPRAVEGPL